RRGHRSLGVARKHLLLTPKAAAAREGCWLSFSAVCSPSRAVRSRGHEFERGRLVTACPVLFSANRSWSSRYALSSPSLGGATVFCLLTVAYSHDGSLSGRRLDLGVPMGDAFSSKACGPALAQPLGEVPLQIRCRCSDG